MNALRRALILLAVLAARTAGAQEVNLARLGGEGQNRVSVRTGAEYGLVAAVGYSRAVEALGRTMLLGADFTLPWAGLDAGDWRLRVSALVPIVGGDHWKLAGTFAPTVRETTNDVARMTGVGVDVGAVGGWYAAGWFAALEAGADWEITTYVANSAGYRQIVYAGARDGWYGMPGGNFRLGLQAGLSFSRFDVALRVGRLLDLDGNNPSLPLYGTLGLTTRF
jgi:hypothetical protein